VPGLDRADEARKVARWVHRRIEQDRSTPMGLGEAVGVEPSERGTHERIVRGEPQIPLQRADCLAWRHRNLRTHETPAQAALLEPVAQQACLERRGGGPKTVQVDETPRVNPVLVPGSGQTTRPRGGRHRVFWPVRRFRLAFQAFTSSH